MPDLFWFTLENVVEHYGDRYDTLTVAVRAKEEKKHGAPLIAMLQRGNNCLFVAKENADKAWRPYSGPWVSWAKARLSRPSGAEDG